MHTLDSPISPLITALTEPGAYSHPVSRVEIIETHISWVLLAGEYAYKIKKPVTLAFVDFSALAARRDYCEDEVRLNRRLAPQVYLGVVAITGRVDNPTVDGDGAALEYAVKMRRFDQDAIFDQLLGRKTLQPPLMDCLAERIAAFHNEVPIITDPAFGTPEIVLQTALDNYSEMAPHADAQRQAALDALAHWTRKAFARLEPMFAARHRNGYVRECHGDLHLRNIALIDGEPVAFDCIEFSAALRRIDVINEVAFLIMDLSDRGRADLGYRFLDGYLQATGDYEGVAVLRFYLVYRAVIRAKIHDLRARQTGNDAGEAARLQTAADHYLTLASNIAHGEHPMLILMHGFSGSGKSRVAAALVEAIGAIRLRSDVERKRLFELDSRAHSNSALGDGIYAREAGERTYEWLAKLAQTSLDAGYPTIIDAAFLADWQRERMRTLANDLGVTLRIVDCCAAADSLRKRVAARAERGDGPSEAGIAVLEHQMTSSDDFTAAEQRYCVHCDMNGAEVDNVAACVAGVQACLPASRK